MAARHNLIARNYKRFTFDLVLWSNFRLSFKHRKWHWTTTGATTEHTYSVRLGFFAITFWYKGSETRR